MESFAYQAFAVTGWTLAAIFLYKWTVARQFGEAYRKAYQRAKLRELMQERGE